MMQDVKTSSPSSLLCTDEFGPVHVIDIRNLSPFLLVCDHAGNRLPRRLKQLGLQPSDLERHIAWDIGAADVTRMMAEDLGSTAILQTYSRLVIDCNREPGSRHSIAESSDGIVIPGNQTLSPAAREMRIAEIFQPYHRAINSELTRRQQAQLPVALISLHSFTPILGGVQRPWDIGVMYNRDASIAGPVIELLRSDPNLTVGDNAPYAITDDTDYTIPFHGERREIPSLAIELRQDLIADAEGQRTWSKRLSQVLTSLKDIMSLEARDSAPKRIAS